MSPIRSQCSASIHQTQQFHCSPIWSLLSVSFDMMHLLTHGLPMRVQELPLERGGGVKWREGTATVGANVGKRTNSDGGLSWLILRSPVKFPEEMKRRIIILQDPSFLHKSPRLREMLRLSPVQMQIDGHSFVLFVFCFSTVQKCEKRQTIHSLTQHKRGDRRS
ncbi:hypothetical protein niasHT_000270 [Heterodera trifolii]|uniref:Uncharacterized protein n=1 Tax=Heterodera trifolii TaxID=157864 RepID=A0ABD2LTC9_9BILA